VIGEPYEPDPIAEAFRTHQRRPKDIVPREPRAEDAMPIPTGPALSYHADDGDGEGMSRETGSAFVGPSTYSVEQLMERKAKREEGRAR
jgi:hypothetical protein